MKAKLDKKIKGAGIFAKLNAWSNALGVDFAVLQKMLTRAEIEYKSGDLISAQKIFQALTFRNEKDEAIARQANAKAEEQEMINAERRKELMELSQIEKIIWNDLLGPLRLELEQMPKSLCGMCNPEEPDVAQKVLEQWVEKTKSNLKGK